VLYVIIQCVHNCTINDATGAISIADAFLVKHSLQVLNVSSNDIGDNGITAIAEALSNSQIRDLFIRKCSITLSGIKALATALVVNKSINLLDVRDNPITVEGTHLIVKAAVDNDVCENLYVDDEYKHDEVKKMIMTLKQREWQKVCIIFHYLLLY